MPGSEAQLWLLFDHGEHICVGHHRLEDEVALVAGGDSGIGGAVALAVARGTRRRRHRLFRQHLWGARAVAPFGFLLQHDDGAERRGSHDLWRARPGVVGGVVANPIDELGHGVDGREHLGAVRAVGDADELCCGDVRDMKDVTADHRRLSDATDPEGKDALVASPSPMRHDASHNEEWFRLLVESVTDYAIFILDTGGHVRTWNAGAERIKGYCADEIIGQHFSIFYPPEDIAAGKTELELEIAARTGRFEEEGSRIRKDGSRFWANVTITAMHRPDGELIGFAEITRDLTDCRKVEETQRLLAAERAALTEKSRIYEFRERSLGILGHDLRNPLASIDMGAGLLRHRSTDPMQLRILTRIQTSALRMSRMIEQILDLTRTRLAGGIPLERKPIDLREILGRIIEELRLAYPSRTIEMRSGPLLGTWDPDRLEQVFSNLVGNALVHGDPVAPITIGGGREGRLVTVTIHNNGTPIPDGLKASIFDPFRRGQLDAPSTRAVGLGLGLYVSREIALAHGGEIDLSSSAIEGTTFRVTLPDTDLE
jgi:PAS domain S-box-containing protein